MGENWQRINLMNNSVKISVVPELGFSLVNFEWKGLEILDTSLKKDFLENRKGLGPLILPHFNQFAEIPQIDIDAFPHIRKLKKLGIEHPFQHGIGRYIPWEFSVENDSIKGKINGNMYRQGYLLSDLTGFDFNANVVYRVIEDGIEVAFDIKGDKPVAAGIHFYYHLYDRVEAKVQLADCFVEGPSFQSLTEPIDRIFNLKNISEKKHAVCTLSTSKYSLVSRFPIGGAPKESFGSLVVFCPANSNFACIEPVSYPVGKENRKKNFCGTIQLILNDNTLKAY